MSNKPLWVILFAISIFVIALLFSSHDTSYRYAGVNCSNPSDIPANQDYILSDYGQGIYEVVFVNHDNKTTRHSGMFLCLDR